MESDVSSLISRTHDLESAVAVHDRRISTLEQFRVEALKDIKELKQKPFLPVVVVVVLCTLWFLHKLNSF